MLRHIAASSAAEFAVGTEIGIMHQLNKKFPEKTFYPVNANAVCAFMKTITLDKVIQSLETMTPQVRVPEEIARKAKRAIDRMLEPWRKEVEHGHAESRNPQRWHHRQDSRDGPRSEAGGSAVVAISDQDCERAKAVSFRLSCCPAVVPENLAVAPDRPPSQNPGQVRTAGVPISDCLSGGVHPKSLCPFLCPPPARMGIMEPPAGIEPATC